MVKVSIKKGLGMIEDAVFILVGFAVSKTLSEWVKIANNPLFTRLVVALIGSFFLTSGWGRNFTIGLWVGVVDTVISPILTKFFTQVKTIGESSFAVIGFA